MAALPALARRLVWSDGSGITAWARGAWWSWRGDGCEILEAVGCYKGRRLYLAARASMWAARWKYWLVGGNSGQGNLWDDRGDETSGSITIVTIDEMGDTGEGIEGS